MPSVEIKRKLTLSRQEAADRLIALGRALADGSEVELSSGADKLKMTVGSRVEWELEIEVDGDETELEIELKWRDDQDSEPAQDAAADAEAAEPESAAPARRRRAPRKAVS